AFDTSVATTAGSPSDAAPGRRMVAPRGTRLMTLTPSFRMRRSRYSPGSTTTCAPGCARPSASPIDSVDCTTTTAGDESSTALADGTCQSERQPTIAAAVNTVASS